MTDWVKLSEVTELSFQPVKRNGNEQFKLWDNTERKFINEGEKIDDREVNRFIKLSDEEKKRYRRNIQFVRDVLVEGETKTSEIETEKETTEASTTKKEPTT